MASVEGDVRTLLKITGRRSRPARWRTSAGESGSAEPTVAAPPLSPGHALCGSRRVIPSRSRASRLRQVPSAARYELRLRAPSDSGEQCAPSRRRLAEAFSPVAPANTSWRARSTAKVSPGVVAKRRLRVVGVSLPPGGYTRAATSSSARVKRCRFSNTDGLEMTYEGAGRYVPASQAVSLYRGETTMVSFRVPGSVFSDPRACARGACTRTSRRPEPRRVADDPVQIVVELRTAPARASPSGSSSSPR